MKKFEVEFKKTSPTTLWMIVTVEAESEEDAEDEGFEQLEAEGILKDACWEIDGVWEVQEKEQA